MTPRAGESEKAFQERCDRLLNEFNDMINHYNSICSMQKERQQE